ncbi:MAG: hypothetical protein ACREYE_00760, partial [Gammaproteobacteria bacterium]
IIKKIERARVKMEQIKPRSTLPRGKKEGGLTVKLFKGHYTSDTIAVIKVLVDHDLLRRNFFALAGTARLDPWNKDTHASEHCGGALPTRAGDRWRAAAFWV